MKASLSRKRIIELFDELDGRFTVMAFNTLGDRISTYGGLNPFLALANAAVQLASGLEVRILLDWDYRQRLSHISDLSDADIWNPDWREVYHYQ